MADDTTQAQEIKGGDGKYGRLFTQDDVNKIAAKVHAEAGAGKPLDEIIFNTDDFTFPADEPLFLLRGKDISAADTIYEYRFFTRDAGSPESQVESVQNAHAAFEAFKQANPERMKAAD